MICCGSACAVVQSLSFERPAVDLQEIQITGLGVGGGSLNLVLDVHNPNNYSLRTLRIETSIDIDGTHFGDVKLEREFTLPAEGNAAIDIPLTFTWSGVGAAARNLLRQGSVNYALDSRIRLNTPIGDQTLDLHNRGVVPLTSIINRIR